MENERGREAVEAEWALRARLGIPADAEQVLILGETSHWDPNWLHTAEEYYAECIPKILDRVLAGLEEEPRRVFSIESLFFFQIYWERHPELHERLRQLVNDGRLRLTGSGITTPDTVLPHTEAIFRDYARGQAWLDEQKMTAVPRLAYLPDDFGHSPALPSLLQALGFDMAAITRIDGMYFVACDYRPKSAFPLPGSSAHLLARELQTADFIWRGPDGAEVLCHWNPFTYFQGDMLAHVGVIRWMDRVYGFSWRSEAHIARRIRDYVRELAPLARTPYLFCPIGCDFNGPIDRLLELVDRYNAKRFRQEGVWVVNAGQDDYLRLVGCHRQRLPTLELDPNPYWMGFYASRPEAKRRCNRIVRKLVLAEKLAVLPAMAPASAEATRALTADMAAAWDLAILSNHHDFITGTSPDRVWRQEQLPWLVRAEGLADVALEQVRAARPVPEVVPRGAPPHWALAGGVLRVETDTYRLVLDEKVGGCLTSLELVSGGVELLAGPANDLVVYRDSGGLWRLGHEFLGGTFAERGRASERPAHIVAAEVADLLEVRVESELDGRPFVRWLWLKNGTPALRMRLSGSARAQRTVTCRFPTILDTRRLTMDVPGGIVDRPAEKLYRPTFWPARSFAHVRGAAREEGLAVFLGGPAAIAVTAPGRLEWIALRYAPRELAFGVLPILAHPARGTDPHEGELEYAVWATPQGDAVANRLPHHVRRALRAALFPPAAPDLDDQANAVVTADHPAVLVTALKPAYRGGGIIARLSCLVREPVRVGLRCARRPIRAATLCDGRERDLGALPVEDGVARLEMRTGLASVRLEL